MDRAFYADSIDGFLDATTEQIVGTIVSRSSFADEQSQKEAWRQEIKILKDTLQAYRGRGRVYLEFVIPRLCKRIDALLLIDGVVFVLEFKVGERDFRREAMEQAHDYALDLKYFHETSRNCPIVPVLVATEAATDNPPLLGRPGADEVLNPVQSSVRWLPNVLAAALQQLRRQAVEAEEWERGRYRPTPTIIEATRGLFRNHRVEEITRTDDNAANVAKTTGCIATIISKARSQSRKLICFVTGVPGAGKTLVGLKVAAEHHSRQDDLRSVFLSGNGPLVKVLREALVRDRREQAEHLGKKLSRKDAEREVASLIQNVHQFRDECLEDPTRPPDEHVAIFDEAQRAWNREKTCDFMRRKRGDSHFAASEPEYLISCLDRHRDWAAIVCLVGGGQEINDGEAGIGEWLDALERRFPHWGVYLSPTLKDSEYVDGQAVARSERLPNVIFDESLHLAVSMRSFRAEKLSLMVKQLLDLQLEQAQQTLREIGDSYPIRLTRDLDAAKRWVREKARGSERYGIVTSSRARRLKPLAITLRKANDLDNDVHWFLNDRDDVRSAFYLEDAATEFNVQGLELDWTIVAWDADFRCLGSGWRYLRFQGSKWWAIHESGSRQYLKNAYRVLLTRARQGMVILVPHGDPTDHTRKPDFYDSTYEYLRRVGFSEL